MPGSSERGKLTLPWSLLLLGSGYFLLVAGPLLTSRFAALRWARDLMSGHAWLPAPAAAGTALLGAAALIYVVARLVRDVEQRPYASIAPVLAVFSGFVLTSTRTEIPLSGLGSAQLGILVLALGLLGGVLIGRDGFSERLLGWLLAVLPSLALVTVLTAALGHSDPATMLRSVDPSLRTYLMLLAVSSLSLGLVGAVARHLVRPAPAAADTQPMPRLTSSGSFNTRHAERPNLAQPQTFHEPPIRMPRPRVSASQPGFRPNASQPMPVHTPTLLGAPSAQAQRRPTPQQALAVRAVPMQQVGPTGYAAATAQPYQVAALHFGSASEIAQDDPDLMLLTRGKFPVSRFVWGLLALALSALVGTYFFVVRPRQHDQDLARVRSASLQPAASPDDSANDQEAAVADAKLRALLERSAAVPTAAASATTALGNAPVVTPFEPEPAAPPATVNVPEQALPSAALLADKPTERAHRSHARTHHAHAAKAARAQPAEDEQQQVEAAQVEREAAPVAARAQPEKLAPEKLEKRSPSKVPAAVPSAPPKTQNEQDLDLDQLLHKAVKSSNGVNAQEDPILGL